MTYRVGPNESSEVTLASTYHRIAWSIVAVLGLAAGMTYFVTIFTLPDTPARFVATFVFLGIGALAVRCVLSKVVVSTTGRVVRVRNTFRSVVIPFDAVKNVDVKRRIRHTQNDNYPISQVQMTCHDGRRVRCRALTSIGYESRAADAYANRLRGLITASSDPLTAKQLDTSVQPHRRWPRSAR
jgi:hypothetical protein